jgi:hypothetical protein
MNRRRLPLKNFFWPLAATLLCCTATTPAMADGIGLSLNIGEPGFFGRIDIGDAPRPQLVSPRPVWIERPRGVRMQEPIYLHVPARQQRNWRRYCREYNACGQPVLFVRDTWYEKSYVPHYRERNGRHDESRDQGRDQGRDHDRDQGRDQGRDHDQSPRRE